MPKTLIFPGGTTEALSYRREALARGQALIGASSIRDDPAKNLYEQWVELPPVFDRTFADRFRETVERQDIDAIYCAHSIIHDRIRALLSTYRLRAHMVNPHPAEEQQRNVKVRLEQAQALRPYMSAVAEAAPLLSDIEIAGLLQATSFVPGQSDTVKLATLMAVFSSLPKGDVVEVGVYWGRSAFALAWLARHYDTGAVLAVDAWAPELALQHDAPDLVQRDTFRQDWNAVHDGFLMHILPVASGRLSYLRAPSQEAARRYPNLKTLHSPPFGPVHYDGRIALLHIDANHDSESARADLAAWVPFVEPNGLIVVDDYVWTHGDGPRRAGDALLDELGEKVALSFVAGGALFLRVSWAPVRIPFPESP